MISSTHYPIAISVVNTPDFVVVIITAPQILSCPCAIQASSISYAGIMNAIIITTSTYYPVVISIDDTKGSVVAMMTAAP